MNPRTLRLVITGVLIASAILFAIGVAIERDTKHRERTGEAHAGREKPGGKTERGGESSGEGEPGHRETSGASGAESPAQLKHEKNSERVFGIDTESTGLVIAAVVISLLFAIALWLSGSFAVPLALAGFALVAAVFDVREVFHQIDESRTNLIVIAAVVAALHLTVVAGALSLAQRARSV